MASRCVKAMVLPAPLPALSFALLFLLLLVAHGGGAPVAAAPRALTFRVGGPRGWRVPDGNTSYAWWAMNNRFRVGDSLYFRYKNDTVIVVDRPAFDSCNATEPIALYNDGATTVPLDRPGFFCFISGEPGHCLEGQRLIVRVMVHPAPAAPAPALAPATSQPGHGGGGGSGSGSGSGSGARPGQPGSPGASSGAAASTLAAGAALPVAMAALGIVMLLQ